MAVRQRNQQASGGVVIEALKNAEKKTEKTLTLLWDELPLWQQDNHYITSGYRPETLSFTKCFISLSYIHNETVNIYSHLLPALVLPSLGLCIYIITPRYHTSTPADVIAFSTFFTSVAICLGMSATYHTISNHSHDVAKFGNKLDYLGIVILIMGSFMPSIYYGFWCHERLMWIYWFMISILGVGCAGMSTVSTFRTPAWRPFRAGMFVAMGGSSIIPVLHGLGIYGYVALEERMGLSYMLLEGVLYILGAGIYAARIPEKWAPGRFDIWGSSHQIFHFLVVAAAASHLVGLSKSFDYLHHTPRGDICT